jgi:hypothetical protein
MLFSFLWGRSFCGKRKRKFLSFAPKTGRRAHGKKEGKGASCSLRIFIDFFNRQNRLFWSRALDGGVRLPLPSPLFLFLSFFLCCFGACDRFVSFWHFSLSPPPALSSREPSRLVMWTALSADSFSFYSPQRPLLFPPRKRKQTSKKEKGRADPRLDSGAATALWWVFPFPRLFCAYTDSFLCVRTLCPTLWFPYFQRRTGAITGLFAGTARRVRLEG